METNRIVANYSISMHQATVMTQFVRWQKKFPSAQVIDPKKVRIKET